MKLGLVGRSRKENERRLPVHPAHFERIEPELRGSLLVEEGYGERFGVADADLGVAVRGREELFAEADVIVLPKPLAEDLAEIPEGKTLWGWPHCVQDAELTQIAIDRRLTLIAWEAMNHWTSDGGFGVHVFHKNNELAGYCSVLHAMQLLGITGTYGPPRSAAVLSFGATARGAVTALTALGVHDVTVLTQRDPASVASPIHTVKMVNYERHDDHPHRAVTLRSPDPEEFVQNLGRFDIVVNCVFQDTEDPVIFATNDELDRFAPGNLIVDVSIDEGMGFEWARPTSFTEPMFEVGEGVHYYGVDHSPSFLFNAATWEISEALLPYLPIVAAGPEAWDGDEVLRRAIEIREGVIQNPKILSFQDRAPEHPHEKR